MVFPKSINIFGLTIKIQISKEQLNVGSVAVDGYADLRNNVMAIVKNKDKLHTFLHESGHFLLFRLGIQRAGLPPEIEEIIVDGYATWVTETFHLRFK